MDTAPLANWLGFLALNAYVATLLPTTLRITIPQIKKSYIIKFLRTHRRQIGLLAFALAFVHGWLLIFKRNIDLYDSSTYWVYIQGVITFIIFTLLALTSNNWAIKKLKKNWKKLHSLTYLCMVFLVWHVWDKMTPYWSYLTPISLCLLTIAIVLFFWRKRLEQLPISSHSSKSKNVITR